MGMAVIERRSVLFKKFAMVKQMMLTRQLWQRLGMVAVAIALMTACLPEPDDNNPPPVGNEPPIENPIPPEDETIPEPEPEDPITQEIVGTVYWITDAGDRLALVPTEVPLTEETPTAQLEALFAQLLTDTPDANLSSTIPPGTELLSLMIQSDGIVVNLSEEFQSGGGSASMVGRVAQVLYTATSLDPSAPIWLQINGEPLEILGGEGLEIAQPLTREIFDADFDL